MVPLGRMYGLIRGLNLPITGRLEAALRVSSQGDCQVRRKGSGVKALRIIGYCLLGVGLLGTTLRLVNLFAFHSKTLSSILGSDHFTTAVILCGVGGMILAVVVPIIYPLVAPASKKAKNGPLVIGQIVALEASSVRVNQEPVWNITIRFTTQDGREITGKGVKVMGEAAAREFAASLPTLVPVRYNPEKPQKWVTVDSRSPDVRAAMNQHYVTVGQATQQGLWCVENGEHLRGVVLWSEPTGAFKDERTGRTDMNLRVRIARPDGSTYEVTTVKAVPQSCLSYTIPGNSVHVFHMPGDEQNVFIGFYDQPDADLLTRVA